MNRLVAVNGENQQLRQLLREAGWSPRALGREINHLAGPGTVAATAPYHWVDNGGLPRPPVPAIVARVFSSHLNRPVRPSDIWPDAKLDADEGVAQSINGFDKPWSFPHTLQVADEWLVGGLMDRRRFLQSTGVTLIQTLSPYFGRSRPTRSLTPSSRRVTDQLADEIRRIVPRLQELDDRLGGVAGLDYVGAQFQGVVLVLRNGRADRDTTRQLLVTTADLAQLAGWKSLDAGRQGLAQRYLLTGLRAAHDAGYRSMEAHILADLAFQAASTGHVADGVQLGEAASGVSRYATAGVRASVMSRLAFAHAAAGDVGRAERTWLEAKTILTNKGTAVEPDWMYYLTDNHLDCQAGYSLILAGTRTEDRSVRKRLLRRGIELLEAGAHAVPAGDPSERRALYEGAWLARGRTAVGDLEEAADLIEVIIPRLQRVQSPRSVALLGDVASDLRRRRRNHRIADVLPDLESALRRQPTIAA